MRMISISFLYWLATINVFLYADFLNFMKYWYVFFINLIKVKKHYITAVIYGMCICFWYIWNSSLYQPYFILVSFHCTLLIE